ncbi:hypothetical protein EOE67_15830 [Rheinheimera riviphila]|uniref:DUF3322 and DUF2220 domain-containing protein n=1 Tax=Rheinheimera riviphila TaxID=1834037 RepID=A0A437QIS6_9GAMM|nr:DUF3322 and DUF2220 domain-containing protein [Rheinheimera riviphila]RVU34336.1 hypothetical protein EOE67_15830 [Rheinheimera riviphila]
MFSLKALQQKVQKKWQSGWFHQAWLLQLLADPNPVQPAALPFRLPFGRLSDKQLLHDFAMLQDELRQLRAAISAMNDVQLEEQDFQFAKMGSQRLPVALVFASYDSIARFVAELRPWRQFMQDCQLIHHELPQLQPWLEQSPNVAAVLRYPGKWPQLLAVCRYFLARPRPDLYLRQLDIPAVDTKFIEQHQSLIACLLDVCLPHDAIDDTVALRDERGFERRFGLRYPEPMIRFRLLDPMLSHDLAGLTDLALPLSDFSKLDLLLDRVFITENKINGLAFPAQNNAMVIFGLGYGIQSLKQVAWLATCQIWYWGDIDSHGFAMLSQLRSYFPKTQSLLMDETTLLECRLLWGTEPASGRHKAKELPCLTVAEQQLFGQLQTDYWAQALRLEQERVPFSLLLEKLAGI